MPKRARAATSSRANEIVLVPYFDAMKRLDSELDRLRELSDQLREAMNRPAVGATPNALPDGSGVLPADAAQNVRLTVRRINELVRKLGVRKEVTHPDR